jgi:transposase InsO family protein
MTVGGFASLREFIRRAVRQLNGVPNDVLTALEKQVRLHHELLLDAWDEMRDRGTAVSHVTDREYELARQLVNEVLQAEVKRVATLWRDQNPVAQGLIEMIAQEVVAHHEEQR